MPPQLLFQDGALHQHLARSYDKASCVLIGYDPDDLLAAAEADVVYYLVGLASVEELTLHRESAYLLDPKEVVKAIASSRDYEFGVVERRVTRWTLVVPFSGDAALFRLQASTFTLNAPRADIYEYQNDLRLYWDSDGGLSTAAQIKTHFNAELERIQNHINFTNVDVVQHNKRVQNEFPQHVAQRRAKHLADKQLQADLGFPILGRSDAATYSVPLNRRRITPALPTRPPAGARPFTPEPALADNDYEAALRVLLNSRNALERSPSMTAKLNEEHIRDLLLMSLNAQFEGKAAGEVFNGNGKTDILIREQDRNIFIGECKIWRGPKTVTDALDQLLGYLVWRDTKAALLLFIRSGDVTNLTAKAVTKIEEHLNYKRRGTYATEERHDFVLHANGDPAREIHLALLPFLISPTAV